MTLPKPPLPMPPLPRPTTYSIRLSKAEKALLSKVLEARGWTATHFIKQATLEKAAQIDNTGRITKFDFDGIARRLARQLCEPEIKVGDSSHPDQGETDFDALVEGGILPRSMYAVTEPPSLVTKDVDTLREATNLGGSEFLRLVLDECDRLMVRRRTDLPEPVDPSKLG